MQNRALQPSAPLETDLVFQHSGHDGEGQYDLTPVSISARRQGDAPVFTIDPWEITSPTDDSSGRDRRRNREPPDTPQSSDVYVRERRYDERNSGFESDEHDDNDEVIHGEWEPSPPMIVDASKIETSNFIMPSEIHPNMEQREEDVAQLRLLAGKLSADWRSSDFMAPALARRIRDFQFAQEKRRKRYGDERPWGILGLYDHLASIRVDVEWAEDAAWRRANGEPYQSWADFDDSKNKGANRPFFTYFLLLVCSLLLVASIAANEWTFEALDENPMIGPSAETLLRMGAKDTYLIVNEHDAWRLLSATVLHAGLGHYIINMLALWFVGTAIETTHGFFAATILFIVPAVGGTILSAIFLPEYITVGASGGIFGLIGACLSDIIMNWKLLFCDFVTENGKKNSHAMVVVFLMLDIVLNSIIGLTPYVDNFTHLGGMAFGFLCGLSTMDRLSTDFFGMEEGCLSRAKQIMVRFLGVILSIICIIITAVILLEGDGETNPCPNCAWLSCVPFPPWEDKTNKWWYCDDCGRVTAEIVHDVELHLQLSCPNGATARVSLDPDEGDPDRHELEKRLPSYCRDLCFDTQRF